MEKSQIVFLAQMTPVFAVEVMDSHYQGVPVDVWLLLLTECNCGGPPPMKSDQESSLNASLL